MRKHVPNPTGLYYYCHRCQAFGAKVDYDDQLVIAKQCSCGYWYKYKKKKEK
ncbi:hypothetical protein KA005_68260 [bacterium]|nr:hypothetical protein [bacterium]